MSEKLLLGFKLDAETGDGTQITCPDTLEAFYEQIGTDVIDIVHRTMGDTVYSIVCDDEGLFKQPLVVTALDNDFRPALVGTLLFFKDGADGELDSLTVEETKNIVRHLVTINGKSVALLLSV